MPNVVAMAGRLPPPAAGQAYDLWVTSHGQTQLAGVMAVNAQGFGLLVYAADQNGPTYDAARLILQSPGSPAPGDDVVLSWTAAHS
jgi:hypothetical protein